MIYIKRGVSLQELKAFISSIMISTYELYIEKDILTLCLIDEEESESSDWSEGEPTLTICNREINFTGSGTDIDSRVIPIIYELTKAGYIEKGGK